MYIVLVNIRLEALREHKPLPNPLSNSDHDQKIVSLGIIRSHVRSTDRDRQTAK